MVDGIDLPKQCLADSSQQIHHPRARVHLRGQGQRLMVGCSSIALLFSPPLLYRWVSGCSVEEVPPTTQDKQAREAGEGTPAYHGYFPAHSGRKAPGMQRGSASKTSSGEIVATGKNSLPKGVPVVGDRTHDLYTKGARPALCTHQAGLLETCCRSAELRVSLHRCRPPEGDPVFVACPLPPRQGSPTSQAIRKSSMSPWTTSFHHETVLLWSIDQETHCTRPKTGDLGFVRIPKAASAYWSDWKMPAPWMEFRRMRRRAGTDLLHWSSLVLLNVDVHIRAFQQRAWFREIFSQSAKTFSTNQLERVLENSWTIFWQILNEK